MLNVIQPGSCQIKLMDEDKLYLPNVEAVCTLNEKDAHEQRMSITRFFDTPICSLEDKWYDLKTRLGRIPFYSCLVHYYNNNMFPVTEKGGPVYIFFYNFLENFPDMETCSELADCIAGKVIKKSYILGK